MTRDKLQIGNVIPKDIKVFYEDGKPYIYYVGIGYVDGRKAEITIPKMGLYLRDIETLTETEYYSWQTRTDDIVVPVKVRHDVYVVHDTFFTVRFLDEE